MGERRENINVGEGMSISGFEGGGGKLANKKNNCLLDSDLVFLS